MRPCTSTVSAVSGSAVTPTVLETDPPGPSQVSVNDESLATSTTSAPAGDRVPVHAPEAVHSVASALDHTASVACPTRTVFESSVKLNVGAPATCTVTVSESDRPLPLQVKVNCVSAVNGPTVSLPEVAFEPDQPPDAVHELALLADQVSSVVSPAPMVGGFADSETFGAGLSPGADRPPLPPHALKVAASSAESHSCTQARVWVLIRRVLRLRPRRPRRSRRYHRRSPERIFRAVEQVTECPDRAARPAAPRAPRARERDFSGQSSKSQIAQLERPFLDRCDLLAQREHLVLPVARLGEPGKGRRKRGIGPASREPRRVVNHAQGAQAFDQHQLPRIEIDELRVAIQQLSQLLGHLAPRPGQQHPQVLYRWPHDAVVEINEVRTEV